MKKHLLSLLLLLAITTLGEPWRIMFEKTLEPDDAQKVSAGQMPFDSWKAFDFTNYRMNLDTVAGKELTVMDVAIMATTIESDSDTVWVAGAACDWWLAVYVNGEVVLSTLRTGNGPSEYIPSEHPFNLPLKKGTNIIAIYTIRGDFAWWMAFARILDKRLLPKDKVSTGKFFDTIKNLESTKISIDPSINIEAGRINHFYPWAPNFNEVPIFSPVISFKWFAKNDDALRNATLQAQAFVETANFKSAAVDVKHEGSVSFDLTGVPKGMQKVLVKISNKNTGAAVHEEAFNVNLRDIPRPAEVTAGKRLNNFTVELVNKNVNANGSAEFVIDHDRWMYFTVKSPAKKDFTMTLDGVKIDDPLTGLPEAFRFVEAGRHTFAVDCGGTLIARTIAEMLTSAICEGPRVTNSHPFDWEYARKWILPALTHLNRGAPNAQMLKLCHDSGRVWSGNMGAVNPATVDIQHNRIAGVMKSLNGRDGVTGDEVFYHRPNIDNYTQALKTNGYDRSKLIYTWAVSYPSSPALHGDFIATCLNASNGHGKILREAYIAANTRDLKNAKKLFTKSILDYFEDSKKLYPDFVRRSGLVLGNFNQINVISLEHYPEIDYKYFLDYQLNFLANDPMFVDLGLTGYWGTHYSDDEMYRWSHRLLRHYVVEGHTDMLSDKYGFQFLPGHIANCDFEAGLDKWTVDAAAKDSVKTDYFSELNSRNQNRWGGAGKIGNTFCVMTRQEGKANTVSQVARNLDTSKKYMLLFIAGDYNDLKAQKFNPREYGIEAKLEDVEIDPAETFVWIDKREKGNYNHNNNIARQNMYRIVFTPKKSEVKLIFTDEKAKPGEQLMFNYIQLKPFFERENY